MASPVVCVVGGGTAGLEGLLLARELLGPQADLRLVAPEREFRYRPTSADSLFRPVAERGLRIADIVAQAGATWIDDRAAAVDDAQRSILTRDGDTVEFDFSLLAAGARSKRALRQGYLWARGGDPSFLDRLLEQAAAGSVRTIAVVVPRGARWPIPAYELALVLAWSASASASRTRVTLITTEARPLDALGTDACDAVVRELEAAGVELMTAVEVLDGPDDGLPGEPVSVRIVAEPEAQAAGALSASPADSIRPYRRGDALVRFDSLISLPTVIGPNIAGVAADAGGFVEVAEDLRVCDTQRVWAAGACIAAAFEHSALAARQADAAIMMIAAECTGATVGDAAGAPSAPELTGMLLTNQRDQWLAENPPGTHEPSTRCIWWPPGRAVGQMLARHIAAADPSTTQALPGNPGGLPIRLPVALDCCKGPTRGAGAPITDDLRRARQRDIDNRQVMAIRRREHEAAAELRALSAGLDALEARQQDAIRELQQHGYLLGRS